MAQDVQDKNLFHTTTYAIAKNAFFLSFYSKKGTLTTAVICPQSKGAPSSAPYIFSAAMAAAAVTTCPTPFSNKKR